jgi:type II secretory pathway pseudopilin PulG
MKIRIQKSQSGTTLVDVIMATCVMGIMASGIVGSFTYGFSVIQMVRENQRATQIILEKVETIRLYSWDQVNIAGFIPTNFFEVYDPQAPNNSQGITYNGSVDIGAVPFVTSYSPKMKQLKVTLNWTSRGVPRTRSLATYISQDGLQNYVY